MVVDNETFHCHLTAPVNEAEFMNKPSQQECTRETLLARAEAELQPQEGIFAQIGDDISYRPILLTLLSNSLRQVSRLRKITESR